MCFESDYTRAISRYGFNGYVAKTTSEREIIETLERFNSNSYKTLRYQQRDDMGISTDDKYKTTSSGWDGYGKE